MYKIKDKEHYSINKQKFNHFYGLVWRDNFSSRLKVGCCSYLYEKANPKSYQDFWEKYLSFADCNEFDEETLKGNYNYGRTEEQLMLIAKAYQNMCKNPKCPITLEECFDDVINHVIIETFDGHTIERYVKDIIESDNKHIVDNVDGDVDAICGVDLIVKKKDTGKISNLIQIKPISFFLGSCKNNISLLNDRKNIFYKQNQLNSHLININRGDEVRDIEYMCYDKTHYDKTKGIKFLTINNRTRFKAEELCERNGSPKLNSNNLIFKEIIV